MSLFFQYVNEIVMDFVSMPLINERCMFYTVSILFIDASGRVDSEMYLYVQDFCFLILLLSFQQ